MQPFRRAVLRAARLASPLAAARPSLRTPFSAALIAAPSRQLLPATFARGFQNDASEAHGWQEDGGRDTAASRAPPAEVDPSYPNVFIANLPFDVTTDHLREMFGQYGEVRGAKISVDHRGMSRGYGFVLFTTADAATAAIAGSHGAFYEGRQLRVAPGTGPPSGRRMRERSSSSFSGGSSSSARTKSKEPTTCLYVGNMPFEATDVELSRLFRGLPGCVDVRVAVNRQTGRARGFAHADFADVESAVKAKEMLLDREMHGRQLKVDYALPVPGFDRTKKFDAGERMKRELDDAALAETSSRPEDVAAEQDAVAQEPAPVEENETAREVREEAAVEEAAAEETVKAEEEEKNKA